MEANKKGYGPQRIWMMIGLAFMLLAGLLHIYIIPEEWKSAPAHGIFMAFAGVVQIGWVLLSIFRPSETLNKVGAVIALSLIGLWGITRVLPAPFMTAPEELSTFSLVTKGCELLVVIALVILLALSSRRERKGVSLWKLASAILISSILLTGVIYAAGKAAEPLFPQLGPNPTEMSPQGY